MIPFIEFDVPHWEDHSPRMDSTPPPSTPSPPPPSPPPPLPPSPPEGEEGGGGGVEAEGLEERAVCDTHDKRLSLCRR